MLRRPPRATRTDTLVPHPTLCRAPAAGAVAERPPGDTAQHAADGAARERRPRHRIGDVERARDQPGAERRAPPRWRHAAFTAASIAAMSIFFIVIIASKARRSEEHTSALQSLMRISYVVFCLKKKHKKYNKKCIHS